MLDFVEKKVLVRNPRNIEGFILAGGKSSRMGTSKSQMTLGGMTFIELAARALSAFAEDNVQIVGGIENDSSGLSVVPDLVFEVNGERPSGAVVGLCTALSAARTDWIAVIACDLPFITGKFFTRLAAYDRTGFDAIVPIQPNGIAQPLCAIYRRKTCLVAALKSVASDDRSLRSMLKRVRTRFIDFNEFSGIENADRLFLNVNSRDDYRMAQELINRKSSK